MLVGACPVTIGSGLYGSVALWLSSALPLLPYTALSSLAYSVIVYQMAGLAADWGEEEPQSARLGVNASFGRITSAVAARP